MRRSWPAPPDPNLAFCSGSGAYTKILLGARATSLSYRPPYQRGLGVLSRVRVILFSGAVCMIRGRRGLVHPLLELFYPALKHPTHGLSTGSGLSVNYGRAFLFKGHSCPTWPIGRLLCVAL